MDQKLAVNQHEGVGNLPAAWRSVAGDLLLAAAVLRDRRESLDQRSSAVEDPVEVPDDARVVILAGVEVRLPVSDTEGCQDLARSAGDNLGHSEFPTALGRHSRAIEYASG